MSPGVCERLEGPRSYEVKVGDRTFVRNCCQLIKSDNLVVKDMLEVEESTQLESGETFLLESAPNPDEVPTTPSTGPRRSSRTNCPDHYVYN